MSILVLPFARCFSVWKLNESRLQISDLHLTSTPNPQLLWPLLLAYNEKLSEEVVLNTYLTHSLTQSNGIFVRIMFIKFFEEQSNLIASRDGRGYSLITTTIAIHHAVHPLVWGTFKSRTHAISIFNSPAWVSSSREGLTLRVVYSGVAHHRSESAAVSDCYWNFEVYRIRSTHQYWVKDRINAARKCYWTTNNSWFHEALLNTSEAWYRSESLDRPQKIPKQQSFCQQWKSSFRHSCHNRSSICF